ncbi:tetratricopeptide repeat protein [Chryseobacterium sp. CT-SW4]|uniref:tetratricopeptide repeat protein n=1 Tax=Chryseobacterium sp. SW-1 TaxID=3157343 RepID=UPI003B028732
MTLTKNKYYFEALDNYPYNLPDCLEALNYALSYEPEDADSLCLMGRIYSETLRDYEQAKLYFEEAMQCDVTNINTPQYYIKCLLDNEDLEEAQKLILFSLKLKGIDKAYIFYLQSVFFEIQKEFKKALVSLKEASQFSYNKSMTDFLGNRKKFLKDKMKKGKGKKKKKKKTQ